MWKRFGRVKEYSWRKKQSGSTRRNGVWPNPSQLHVGEFDGGGDETQTGVISESKELYGFLSTPGIDVLHFVVANEYVVWISWKYRAEEDVPSLRYTNDVIGTYVTAGARLHLYRYIDRLRENVKYCNTDSLIYIQPRDGPELFETGDKLGDMTYELRPSQTISGFVSGGPKNYAYRVLDTVTGDGLTVCK